jgi:radical SAM family uncharacterized protein
LSNTIEKFLDHYLITVQKPGRYIGGEYNQVRKQWTPGLIKLALAFPDIYDIGFSNLGLMILYDLINKLPDALAERVYAPWVDMEEIMRLHKIPLFSLENKKPLTDFDAIGFSIPYESLYTNVLNMLDIAGIPIRSDDRDEKHPIIIAGGHACFNPEPMHDFIDAFVIGEGEEIIYEIIDFLKTTRSQSESKTSVLDSLSQIKGIYIPSHFQVTYFKTGLIKSITNIYDENKPRITKRIIEKLPPPPTRLLVPNISVVHERMAVEIMRGCTRGCRFCQAGIITRPVRERSIDEIVGAIEASARETGFEEISLLSLSSSDYSNISELLIQVQKVTQLKRINLSLPSLRVESFNEDVIANMQSKRKGNFTLAPESASENIRRSINKPISELELLKTVENILQMGWRNIKLYFMIGFPNETTEDVESIVNLCKKVKLLPRKLNKPPLKLHVSINTFIPKPHTAFQWDNMSERDDIDRKYQIIRDGLRKSGIKLNWPSFNSSLFEAILSRGDRKLSSAIEEAWRLGAKFDAWNESFNFNIWESAFQNKGIEPDFIVHRERYQDEIFPWEHIESGVSKDFLYSEYQNSKHGELTPDCRNYCHACGIQTLYGINCNRIRSNK